MFKTNVLCFSLLFIHNYNSLKKSKNKSTHTLAYVLLRKSNKRTNHIHTHEYFFLYIYTLPNAKFFSLPISTCVLRKNFIKRALYFSYIHTQLIREITHAVTKKNTINSLYTHREKKQDFFLSNFFNTYVTLMQKILEFISLLY